MRQNGVGRPARQALFDCDAFSVSAQREETPPCGSGAIEIIGYGFFTDQGKYKTGPVGLANTLYRLGGDLAGWSGKELIHNENYSTL